MACLVERVEAEVDIWNTSILNIQNIPIHWGFTIEHWMIWEFASKKHDPTKKSTNPQCSGSNPNSLGSCSCFPACFSKSFRLQCPVLSSQMVPKWCFFWHKWKAWKHKLWVKVFKTGIYIFSDKNEYVIDLHVYIPAPEIPAMFNSFWQVGPPLIESTNDNEHHEGSCAEYHLNIYIYKYIYIYIYIMLSNYK